VQSIKKLKIIDEFAVKLKIKAKTEEEMEKQC